MTQGSPTFNLVDEPWITVVTTDGRCEDVSLLNAFVRARGITRIVGEVPTQSFAILRLLLAVLHRASGGPQSVEQWVHARDDWDDAVGWVRGYLAAFHERFDLRDPAMPFFQVADLRSASDGVSGLAKLIADVPNGEPYFTTRIGRGIERISWAEAARWLVHVHAFDPAGIRTGAVGDPRAKGGKGYPIGPGWAGQLGGVHVVGETLAETLLLDLVVPHEIDVMSGPADLPPWERPPQDQCEDHSNGGQPRGLVDLYTWQARRVRLDGDSEGVTGLVLAQGDRMTPQNRQTLEPLTGWRFSEPQTKKHGTQTYMPREHSAERAFWRGLSGLLPQVSDTVAGSAPARYQEPGVLQWVAKLRWRGELTAGHVRVRAIGVRYVSNQSTFDEIVDDELVVPLALLTDAVLAQAAVDGVAEAEAAVNQLANLAHNVALAAGASTEDEGPRERARERAYSQLDVPYRRWLIRLGEADDVRESRVAWQRELNDLAYGLSRDLVEQAGTAAWVGRRVKGRHVDLGLAEAWFLSGLRKVLTLAVAVELTPAAQEEIA